MADNSNSRRKALVVSMLAFLLIGGGVFLFFIIQGSDDLTGKGKKNNFRYGSAAREGVSSFFKAIGIAPDEEETRQKYQEARMEARGFLADGQKAGVADVSGWMANNSAPAPSGSSSSPGAAAVPRMSGSRGGSGGGSGRGTKSAGGTSRFGAGATSGNTSISAKAQSGETGAAGKGTLGALKNASAMLGEGLKSNSATTASSKWGQGFGTGGGGSGGQVGGNLAYGNSGLVKLDTIKSGAIASLKPLPTMGGPTRDKETEKGDKGLEAAHEKASEKSKEDTAAKQKKELAETLVNAAGGAVTGAIGGAGGGAGTDRGGTPAATDPGRAEITQAEKDEVSTMFLDSDKEANITRNPDGGLTIKMRGTDVSGDYEDIVTKAKDGTLTFGVGP